MQITWHGQYTVKIVSKDTTLVIDPYSPSVGLPPFRSKAEIVALSNPSDADMSYLQGIQGEPKVINSPGEYSLNGFTLHAVGWRENGDPEKAIQQWVIEDMTLLHVGALNRELTDVELQQVEKSDIDILFVPIGGGNGLTTKQALALVSTVEPRLVVPIHYRLPKLKEKLEPLELFAKEMGVDPKNGEKKLNVKAKNLPQEDTETIILVP